MAPVYSPAVPSVTAALNIVSHSPRPAASAESKADDAGANENVQKREKSEILKRLNEKMLPEKDVPSNQGPSKWGVKPDFTFSDVSLKSEATVKVSADENDSNNLKAANKLVETILCLDYYL